MNQTPTTGIPAGTIIGGRYAVSSLLGRGGMAAVYRARDVPLDRNVALKVFEIDTEATAGLGRESSEIRLLASLNHHALVTLFDANVETGDGADRSYLVMELVEGPTLAERIGRGPIAEIDVAQMVVDLAEALHVVHGNGVVHRDVKPANILLNPSALPAIEFRAKLSDFGIAYLIDSTRLTSLGTIIGTAAYLSPEQAQGVAPEPPADVYSLGLVTLEALTGTRAFGGTMLESVSARLVNDPEIPDTLGNGWRILLARMTAREPADRPTALEVVEFARQIERDVYAAAAVASTVDPEATQAVEPPTAVMPVLQQNDDRDAATSVLPAASALTGASAVTGASALSAAPAASVEAATTVLSVPPTAETASPKIKPERRSRLWIVLVVIVGLLGLGAGGFAIVTLMQNDGTAAETVEPVPLPTNEGVLGTHLDELLESVTP